MMRCFADMPSYTFAMKAQKILKARGYVCEIKRNTSSAESGCGYYISVSADCSEIKDVLESYSVPFEKMRKESEDEQKYY